MKKLKSSINNQKFLELIAWLRDPKNKKVIEKCLIDSLEQTQQLSKKLQLAERISMEKLLEPMTI